MSAVLAPLSHDPSFAELLASRPMLRMDASAGLCIEEVPLVRLAQAVGTPTGVYSAATLTRT